MWLSKFLFHGSVITVLGYLLFDLYRLFRVEFTKLVIIRIVIVLCIVIFYLYKFHRSLVESAIQRKHDEDLANKDKKRYDELVKTDIYYFDSSELSDFISDIRDFNRRSFFYNIHDKLVEAEEKLVDVEKQEHIDRLNHERNSINKEIQELKQEKRRLENEEESKIEDILEELNAEDETIFYKEDLTEEEVEVLKKEGFRQSNEYSIFSNKNETVLIKPVLNHSNTHIFLCYQIKELLEDLEMEKVEEHLTRDADLTFKHKNKYYAIEVETGNLLKKKSQLKEKIEYLNNKYKNRWLFVLTNKNYVSEYKKYGFATQRSQVKKTLEKWLKINTQ